MKRRGKARRTSPSTADPWSAQMWAAATFGAVELPDRRLCLRAVRTAAALAAKPLDSIPQAHDNWGQSKATYRFIENERVTVEALVKAEAEATARRCAGRPEIRVLVDLTTLSFPHAHATEGLGPVGEEGSRGMLVQSALAVSESGVTLGLLDLLIWCRDPDQMGSRRQAKKRTIEEKESRRWLDAVRAVDAVIRRHVPEGRRPKIIFVFDREGDIHEAFDECLARGHSFVIRCQYNRRVEDPTADVDEDPQVTYAHQAVRQSSLLARRTVAVPRKAGQPARRTTVELRAIPVRLSPPRNHHPNRQPLLLNRVEVWEPHPPKGVKEPLHWRLWTPEPATTVSDVGRVQGIYQGRWHIEDYHKILKSGCRVEQLQFETANRLAKMIAFYAPISARILRLRDSARQEPDAPCTVVLSAIEWQALWTKIHDALPPARCPPPTLRQAVLWIGRLGGHLNRKSDGMPGIKTLWLGWRDLLLLTHFYAIVRG